MTCKDCIHERACFTYSGGMVRTSAMGDKAETKCGLFKNKANYAEVKHGEWDVGGINPHNNTVGNWHCSVCKGVSLKDSNYCPNCGAKMDLKEGAEE